MSGKPRTTSGEKVGYGKPPHEHRFQKGMSGNPRGRPKGSGKSRFHPLVCVLSEVVRQEVMKTIKIQDGDEFVELPILQVAIRATAHKAARGDRFAVKQLTDLARYAESERMKREDEHYTEMLRRHRQAQEQVAERRSRGLSDDDVVPHPEDFIFDERAAAANFSGPWNQQDKEAHDKRITHRNEIEALLADDASFMDNSKAGAEHERVKKRLLSNFVAYCELNDSLGRRYQKDLSLDLFRSIRELD